LGTTRLQGMEAAVREESLNSGTLEAYMVSADGLEPSTHALKGHCSAS
jgi:hypothetical protein